MQMADSCVSISRDVEKPLGVVLAKLPAAGSRSWESMPTPRHLRSQISKTLLHQILRRHIALPSTTREYWFST